MSKCRKPNKHTHSHTAAKSTTTTTQQVYTPSALDVLRQFMYAWNKSPYIPARDLSNSIFGLLPETEKPSQSNTICNLLNRLQWAQIERLFACNMRISFSPILCLFVSSFICRSTKPVEIDFYILRPWGFGDFNPFCYCLISTNFLFHHRTVLFFAFFPRPLLDVMTHCIATSTPHAVVVWLSLCGVIANATILPIPYSFGWNEILLCGFFWFLCFRYV